MRTLVIDSANVVVNAIMADPDYELPGFTLLPSDVGGPGFIYDPVSGAFTAPPPPPEPVPETISSRQFFQQLAKDGDISEADALAYVSTGALPKMMLDAIAQLPADQQFDVKMAVIGANTFDRHNPTTAQLGLILQKDDLALDDLWRKAFRLP